MTKGVAIGAASPARRGRDGPVKASPLKDRDERRIGGGRKAVSAALLSKSERRDMFAFCTIQEEWDVQSRTLCTNLITQK